MQFIGLFSSLEIGGGGGGGGGGVFEQCSLICSEKLASGFDEFFIKLPYSDWYLI